MPHTAHDVDSPATPTERGAVASEYAIMASLIAIMIFTGVTLFGSAVADIFAGFPDIWHP